MSSYTNFSRNHTITHTHTKHRHRADRSSLGPLSSKLPWAIRPFQPLLLPLFANMSKWISKTTAKFSQTPWSDLASHLLSCYRYLRAHARPRVSNASNISNFSLSKSRQRGLPAFGTPSMHPCVRPTTLSHPASLRKKS